MGNLRSVAKALEHVGAHPVLARDHDEIRTADGIVLPGVGAYPKAMAAVRELGLGELLEERLREGTPTLGICLGMQLLFEHSPEQGGADGLGFLEGRVEPLPAPGLKVPQIGWNAVEWRRPSSLADGLPQPSALYHVHSFAPVPRREEDVLATATYGNTFITAVEREPIYGVQFHPEKSGEHGLRLLGNFCGVARRAGERAPA